MNPIHRSVARRNVRVLAVLGAVILFLSACRDDDDGNAAATSTTGTTNTEQGSGSEEELEELIAAAQEEGTVMLYSAMRPEVLEPALAAFSEKYGIDAQFLRLGISELGQRYLSEVSSGAPVADVLEFADGLFVVDNIQNGILTSLEEAGIPGFPGDFPEEYVRYDGQTAVVSFNTRGIGFNTDIDERPDDYRDLLDPRWRGRIVSVSPVLQGQPAWEFWDFILETYGEEFLTEFRALEPHWEASSGTSGQLVAAGEYALAIPMVGQVFVPLAAQGAPVDIVMPADTVTVENYLNMSTDAPHPNAARLLIHYLLSEDGNTVLNPSEPEMFIYGPYGGEGLPDNATPPRSVEAADPARQAEIAELLGL